MFTTLEMQLVALRSLVCDQEPAGMFNPQDNEERERLAVACVRAIKAECGVEPETEREEYCAAVETAERLAQWTHAGKVTSFLFRMAQSEVRTQREYARNFPQMKDTRVAFFRSRAVCVNGVMLKLKWSV